MCVKRLQPLPLWPQCSRCIAVGAQTIKCRHRPQPRVHTMYRWIDYRQHLAGLAAFVDACAKERNTKAAIPPSSVPMIASPSQSAQPPGSDGSGTVGSAYCFRRPKSRFFRLAKPDAKEPATPGPKSQLRISRPLRNSSKKRGSASKRSRAIPGSALRRLVSCTGADRLAAGAFRTGIPWTEADLGSRFCSREVSAIGSTAFSRAPQISRHAPPGWAAPWCGDSSSAFA